MEAYICNKELSEENKNKIEQVAEELTAGAIFGVYSYGEDYILHSELKIIRLSSDLVPVWTFSGNDIFVSQSGDENVFEMKKDRICLCDWSGDYCEIDYNGKLMKEN